MLFPCARNLNLIVQYWLVTGTYSSVARFKIELNFNQYKLHYKIAKIKPSDQKITTAHLIRNTYIGSVPPPRQPSGRVLASSAGGPGFNPQSRTASSIAQWQSAGFEYGRSRVQSPVKNRVISKTLYKWYQQCPCLSQNGKYWLFLKN